MLAMSFFIAWLVEQNSDVCVVQHRVERVQWRELVDADVIGSLCGVTDELERSLTLWLVVVVEIVDVQRPETGRKRPQARTSISNTSVHLWSVHTAPANNARSSAVAKRPRDVSCLSVVSFVASIVQYLKRSFFIISYFSFGFTIVHTIRFCSVIFSVTSSLAVIHTIYRDCVLCESALGRSGAEEPRRRWLYRAWRLVVEYPQYTTSDIIVTTCEMMAVVHRRPSLQHLACCSVNSRHIGSESRFLPAPPAFDAPVREVPVGISPSGLVRKN